MWGGEGSSSEFILALHLPLPLPSYVPEFLTCHALSCAHSSKSLLLPPFSFSRSFPLIFSACVLLITSAATNASSRTRRLHFWPALIRRLQHKSTSSCSCDSTSRVKHRMFCKVSYTQLLPMRKQKGAWRGSGELCQVAFHLQKLENFHSGNGKDLTDFTDLLDMAVLNLQE